MKALMTLLFIAVTAAISIAAVTPNQPTQVQAVSGVNFTTSAQVSGVFPTPAGKSASVVITKTGLGKGQAYLQGSNDGTNWKDINATTYPGASGTVSAGTTAIMLSVEANPWAKLRYLFKEDGTNSGVITGGKWISK